MEDMRRDIIDALARYRRGFTLVEIMVVMIIIGILGLIGGNLSWGVIGEGKARADASEAHDRYDRHLANTMMTTVYEGFPYTGMTVSIISGGSSMSISYQTGTTGTTFTLGQGGYFIRDRGETSSLQQNDALLTRTKSPLRMDCSIQKPVSLYLVYPSKRFCWKITPKTCTLFTCD